MRHQKWHSPIAPTYNLESPYKLGGGEKMGILLDRWPWMSIGSKVIHQHSSIIKGLKKISGRKTLKKLVSITCECTKRNPEWHKLLHHMCEWMWKKEAIWKSAPSWSSWWVSRRSNWGGKSPKRRSPEKKKHAEQMQCSSSINDFE